jgi:hypothetical protein
MVLETSSFRLSALTNRKPVWPLPIQVRTDGDLCSGGLEKERYFGAATAQLYRCSYAMFRFVASLAEKRKERERQKKRKGKERK